MATDYVGTQIIRRYNSRLVQTPTQIQMAADLGLGTDDPDRITFQEVDFSSGVPEAGTPIALSAVALTGIWLRRRGGGG